MTESLKTSINDLPERWPALPLEAWKDTCTTLHMWAQIVGKVRLALTPAVNHWWNVPFYVVPRGLTTSAIPYSKGIFEVQFDFIDHMLVLRTNDGLFKTLPLVPRSVADFYHEFMALLQSVDILVRIWRMPVEVPTPVPFDQDRVHTAYDPKYAHRFWQILVSAGRVFEEFRSRFIGKCSPVHFFWGSFDLAVTRFSGRRAPERKGADAITREAYSHEVSSVGFWSGGDLKGPAFYSYMAPAPPGFSSSRVRPDAAFYHQQLGEFLLMYDDVRTARSPSTELLEFCQSTYEAGANLAEWDRAALEKVS
jgi:Family of unknown function (DUF5996)